MMMKAVAGRAASCGCSTAPATAATALLNGGRIAWVEEGYPTSTETPSPEPTQPSIEIQPAPTAELPDVLAAIKAGGVTIWDARSPRSTAANASPQHATAIYPARSIWNGPSSWTLNAITGCFRKSSCVPD